VNTTANHIGINEIYEIRSLKENDLTLKLAEMGCVPGTEIVRLYQSSGGNTIAFRIDTYLLGLRKEEANQIEVTILELDPA